MGTVKHIRKFLYRRYLGFNHQAKFLESIQVSDPVAELPYRPVFILGAPRCGSTLAYQNLASTLDFSYFSNRHCFWFGAPWLIEQLTDAPGTFRKHPVFDSKHGHTEGWYAPSECGEYWYRFFRRFPPFVTEQNVDPQKMQQLRKSLHAFLKASRKPLLIKNLYSTLRIEPIIQAVPEAVFLVMHRREKDTAHSILKARKRKFGNYQDWFSLETPGFKKLKDKPPEAQVVEQIRGVYKLISDAEKKYSDIPFYHFNYEDFCRAPQQAILQIQYFLQDNGVQVEQKMKAPSAFTMRDKVTIDPLLYERLSRYLEKNPIK